MMRYWLCRLPWRFARNASGPSMPTPAATATAIACSQQRKRWHKYRYAAEHQKRQNDYRAKSRKNIILDRGTAEKARAKQLAPKLLTQFTIDAVPILGEMLRYEARQTAVGCDNRAITNNYSAWQPPAHLGSGEIIFER